VKLPAYVSVLKGPRQYVVLVFSAGSPPAPGAWYDNGRFASLSKAKSRARRSAEAYNKPVMVLRLFGKVEL